MRQTVTALFDHYDDAADAVRRLEDEGVSYRDISIVSNAAGKAQIVPLGSTDDASAGAGAGAGVGAALGGGAGLLAGLGLVTIPGLGPMLAAGWLLAAAAGATAGAAAGGLIGLLVGAGVSGEDAHVYSEGLRRGGTLVIARVESEQYEEVRTILARSQVVDIAERRKSASEAAPDRGIPGKPAHFASNPLIENGRVTGTGIYDRDGKHIGAVKRLMIGKKTGRVAYVVMESGGFLGVGEEKHLVPWGALTYDMHLQGYRTSITEDRVHGAPAFYRDPNWDWSDQNLERVLHDHYGAKYYWG
jgi:hypothetical protein